jgi:uncharacterized pyridoxamine 5'-phosphate oxidase family protein
MEKQEAINHLNSVNLAYVATIDNNEPRVRIMSITPHKSQYWCCTITGREKIEQIKQNNNFEFSFQLAENQGSIRARGKVDIIEELELKKEISEVIPWFDGYWKSHDDPKFTLFRLNVDRIVVQQPGRIFHKFDL